MGVCLRSHATHRLIATALRRHKSTLLPPEARTAAAKASKSQEQPISRSSHPQVPREPRPRLVPARGCSQPGMLKALPACAHAATSCRSRSAPAWLGTHRHLVRTRQPGPVPGRPPHDTGRCRGRPHCHSYRSAAQQRAERAAQAASGAATPPSHGSAATPAAATAALHISTCTGLLRLLPERRAGAQRALRQVPAAIAAHTAARGYRPAQAAAGAASSAWAYWGLA